MSQHDAIQEYVKWHQNRYTNDSTGKAPIPIFEVVVFEHPDREMIYHKPECDVKSGFPDTGSFENMGFYYELDTAIKAMNENWCDIQETVFYAGFVFCRFPGLYNSVVKDARIYFLWDKEKKGFFEAKEPAIFEHIAF